MLREQRGGIGDTAKPYRIGFVWSIEGWGPNYITPSLSTLVTQIV